MPELPEVETVRRSLNRLVKGKRIRDVVLHYPKLAESPTEMVERLRNRTIREVLRHGKFLVFDLGDTVLLSHLRMEGKYFLKESIVSPGKHDHVDFVFDDGETLRYHDVRKFGTFHVRSAHDYTKHPPLSNIGWEPIDPDYPWGQLYIAAHKSRRPIKSVLLDQSVVSGLGNIYVDETLYCAGVHPSCYAHEISEAAYAAIERCARKVLEKAITLGGSSIRSYTDSLGISGRFQNELNVHMREHQSCPQCGARIEKIKVGGRGTYVCPHCQR